MFEDVRDFIILHYHATTRDDSEFWKRCRAMSIPDSLAEKMELFRAKARVFREGFDLFATTSWVAVFLGQHVVPEEYEPAGRRPRRGPGRGGARADAAVLPGLAPGRCPAMASSSPAPSAAAASAMGARRRSTLPPAAMA
jgi:hypothetical protein